MHVEEARALLHASRLYPALEHMWLCLEGRLQHVVMSGELKDSVRVTGGCAQSESWI